MYKTLTAEDYRAHLGLPQNYKVDSFIVYGTFNQFPFEQFEKSVDNFDRKFEKVERENPFFQNLREYIVDGKVIWVAIAYGGALLSEYVHLACLFGSRKNIHIGSCGGLNINADSMDIIIPTWSYAEESSAKAYEPKAENRYHSDDYLSEKLAMRLPSEITLHTGSTITYQAMMAETWEDVLNWSEIGHLAVEMEAATVFAVSNHFKVPSAAILMISDNLIKKETVNSDNYKANRNLRMERSQIMFDIAIEEILLGSNDLII
jgi:purine-nucleoside phosphorylase